VSAARPARRRCPGAALLVAAVVAFVLLGLAAARPAPAAAATPPVSAPSGIVIEASSGDVAWSRRPDDRRAFASTTKLMTALVALSRVGLDDVLTAAPYHPAPAETRIGLRSGERMRVADLLRALLLPSANDAAATLARGVAGSQRRFVALMNARARQLGLTRTHFTNAVGLDAPSHRSTARDLAHLALAARAVPFIAHTADLPRAKLRSGAVARTVVNRNPLIRAVPWVNGMKTGHTGRAGYVLIGSGTKRGITVVSVVLGASSEAARARDTINLLNYGVSRYRRATPVRKGAVLARVPLRFRDERVDLVAARTHRLVVRRDRARPSVRLLGVPDELDGPLPRGARIATAEVRYGGRIVARVPLVTARAVDEAGLATQVEHFVMRPLVLIGLLVLVAAAAPYVAARRLRRRPGRPGAAPSESA
jgi:serine-type D-Ala-D-Ala carboxypeptidase (penicillin-binding protein 5/6)